LEKTNEDKKLDKLKTLYQELAEISKDEGARVDLDLLFVDILDAIELNPDDYLPRITREEIADMILERVRSPLGSN